MQPPVWTPPVALSPIEQQIVKRIKRAKLFIFLRHQRHTLFDPAFQQELAAMYKDAPQGQPPIPPAQLALAAILQTYTGVSDDELIEATVMDRRWQLVLDCLDADTPPFSKPTLIAFRQRVIATPLDRRLLERTVEVAAATRAFGSRQLRAALSSSPLWGAGRVEDTYNLLGHALRKALGVIARQQGRGLAELAAETGAGLVGSVSLKAALDLAWDDPAARDQALAQILDALTSFAGWLDAHPAVIITQPELLTSLAAAAQVRDQDVTSTAAGTPTLCDGVAPERRISIEDRQMRHGRKSRSQLIDGYKRHVLRDLDSGLVPAVGITPANVPEAQVTDSISLDLLVHGLSLRELHIDRAYLSSNLVRERDDDLEISCRAWPVRQGAQFAKTAFVLDWERHEICCPDEVVVPFTPGGNVQFPAERGRCLRPARPLYDQQDWPERQHSSRRALAAGIARTATDRAGTRQAARASCSGAQPGAYWPVAR